MSTDQLKAKRIPLECLHCEQNVFIFGDFDIHYEKFADCNVSSLRTLLDEHDLKQVIDVPTHISGHTLDLCIYRCPDICSISPDVKNMCLSDHFVDSVTLPFPKPMQR